MIKTVCLAAAFCFLALRPFALLADDAPPVIERAPDSQQPATQEELATLRRENEQLAAERDLARKTAATLNANLASLSAAKTDGDAALAASTRELAAVRTKLTRLESSAPSKPAAAPSSDLAAKLAQTETTLASTVRSFSQLQSENDRLKTVVAEQSRHAADLEKQLQEKSVAETDVAARQSSELSAKLADTEAKLATTLRSFSLLQADNDRLKSNAGAHATLAEELQKARAENAALAARAATPAPVEKSSDLTARLADAEGQLATTLHSFSQLQTENDRLKADTAAQSAELEKLRQENAGLQSRPAEPSPDLTAKLAQTEDKLATALHSYSQLATENDRLKADAARTADEAQSSSAKISAEAAARASTLFDELRQTQARAAALAAENSELKTHLALAGPPPGSALAAPSRPSGPPPTPTANSAPQNPVAPNVAAPADASRQHMVAPGDTLAKISREYYGTPNRWDEILRANADVIKDENVLTVGSTLRIP